MFFKLSLGSIQLEKVNERDNTVSVRTVFKDKLWE